MEKKNGFHQPQNQLSTSKNQLFLWKLFSPNSNNGFYQLKIALIKTQFSQDRIFDFNEIIHSDYWKRIFSLVKTVFFCSEFFFWVETIIDISGGQFLKEDYISTNENWFSGWRKQFSSIFCYHFLPFSLLSEKWKKMVSTSQKISCIT